MSAISSRTLAISSFCIEGQSDWRSIYTERRDSKGSLLTATPDELASRANESARGAAERSEAIIIIEASIS
jgi:hypothetical protein